ncbi:MAG: FkbM family methyltransferase [Phycisphaerales bacterium]|jgi:FkbM family methyltransferase|nr:FkbM family methyltransferase [Phycisphaerales bacterium]
MGLTKTLRYILNHPLNRPHRVAAMKRFVNWQFGSRMVPGAVLIDWVDDAKMMIRPGDHGLTGNIYCGLQEFEDMSYLLNVTTPEDLFIDVGANAGAYSILACKARGAKGHCYEPVPSTFETLKSNLNVNDLAEQVKAMNVGIADKEGTLRFHSDLNCENRVLAEGENPSNSIDVPVHSLDSLLEGLNPTILKVDVEGFEGAVVEGADSVLSNPSLHSIIIELRGHGAKFGFDEDAVLKKLLDYGFSSREYDPFTRDLRNLNGLNTEVGNTLLTRNEDLVMSRLEQADKITINGHTY